MPVAVEVFGCRNEGDAETPRIAEPQPAARRQIEAEVFVGHERRPPVDQGQAAAHPQMQYQRLSAGRVDPQVLRPPAQAADRPPFEAAEGRRAERFTQGRKVDAHRLEAVAHERPLQAPAQNLDLGQLRHRQDARRRLAPPSRPVWPMPATAATSDSQRGIAVGAAALEPHFRLEHPPGQTGDCPGSAGVTPRRSRLVDAEKAKRMDPCQRVGGAARQFGGQLRQDPGLEAIEVALCRKVEGHRKTMRRRQLPAEVGQQGEEGEPSGVPIGGTVQPAPEQRERLGGTLFCDRVEQLEHVLVAAVGHHLLHRAPVDPTRPIADRVGDLAVLGGEAGGGVGVDLGFAPVRTLAQGTAGQFLHRAAIDADAGLIRQLGDDGVESPHSATTVELERTDLEGRLPLGQPLNERVGAIGAPFGEHEGMALRQNAIDDAAKLGKIAVRPPDEILGSRGLEQHGQIPRRVRLSVSSFAAACCAYGA